ncbi:MAG: alpha/beta fold hydrolase [Chloroflexi bacterium]|nr:alpha/beta fold hydrolase [Chloroflexota bacterium]
MKWISLIALILTCLLLAGCAKPVEVPSPEQPSEGVKIEHKFVEAGGVEWHYVEAGKGEPVVFLHGLPESWFSWHYQIETVSKKYRVIAVDLKGYGQSDKSDGDYTAQGVANELIALFDAIGLDRFSLVTHDWGTLIGDCIASTIPDRIVKYIRMEAPVLKIDPTKHPQFELFKNQDVATGMMSQARTFITMVYEPRTVQKISDEDMEGIIFEFSRPGVAEAVPRYFRDFRLEDEDVRLERFSKMTFPVLVLQGEKDPAQPLWYYEGIEEVFPNVEFQIIEDSGHFTELEKPEEVSKAILDFLSN